MRTFLANYFLKREAAKVARQAKQLGLDKANSFLILYNASQLEEIKALKEISFNLAQQQKKTVALCLINEKDLPEFRTEARNFNFITPKELNLLSLPKKTTVNELQSTTYDVLINLSAQTNTTLSYLALKAHANFKIAQYLPEESFVYDFMIDCKKDTSIVNFTAQVLHYLSLIKND
ncbi:hypothetical protein D3C80_203870 [compost metagenome]